MKRDPRLIPLSEEHHHGLVFALRIERELPGATDEQLSSLYADLLRFWVRGLLPHFHSESECLLARLIQHVSITDPAVQRLQEDHLSMQGLVARMRDAVSMADRRAALQMFGQSLRTHIHWEEATFFERVQRELPVEALNAAGAEIARRHPKLERPPWQEL